MKYLIDGALSHSLFFFNFGTCSKNNEIHSNIDDLTEFLIRTSKFASLSSTYTRKITIELRNWNARTNKYNNNVLVLISVIFTILPNCNFENVTGGR